MAQEFSRQPSQAPQEPQEEKLEFLKREEVRTMAKDIARVREQESRSERERIADLQPKKEQKVALPQQEQPEERIKRSLMPKRIPTSFEKLFVRIVAGGVIVFVLFNVVAFGIWQLQRGEEPESPEPERQQEETEAPSPTPEPEQPAEQEPAPAPARTPVSFFEAPRQELLLGNSKELLPELQALLFSLPLGFLNIVVKTQVGILSTQELLEKSRITMPPALKDRLEENAILFAYHQDNKKRLGVVFEVKNTEGLTEQLQSWEQTLEQDTSGFFDIIGGKGSAYTPFFRSLTYKSIPIRFQTFSVIDFGIVYGVVKEYLLLTSSLESFQRAADELETI